MKSKRIAIGIPVHGWSEPFAHTLEVLEQETDPRLKGAELVIVNSNQCFEYASDLYEATIISIPSDHYWTKAVADIYEYCHNKQKQCIILMNHDCAPEPGCLKHLLDFHEHNMKAVAHAALVYKDNPEKVWWAGAKQRFARRNCCLYENRPRVELPTEPYLVDSTMGQCMIIPIGAAQPKFLHTHLCPNTGGDPVQTTCMRRAGFPVHVVPDAIAQTDQSDAGISTKNLYINSWRVFLKSLFHPISERYLLGVISCAYIIQDSKLGGVILAIYLAAGKTVYSFLELIGLKRRGGVH